MTAPTCSCGCGRRPRPDRAGLAEACYQRWRKAGRPADGPPPPKTPGNPAGLTEWAREQTEERLSRIAEFAMVRATRCKPNGDPVSIGEAAAAVGVSARTGQRYATALKTQPIR